MTGRCYGIVFEQIYVTDTVICKCYQRMRKTSKGPQLSLQYVSLSFTAIS